MIEHKKVGGSAAVTGIAPAPYREERRRTFSLPLTDRIPTRSDEIAIHNIPGLVIDKTSDTAVSQAARRIGRMLIDNYPTIGHYVADLMRTFNDARRCTVYLAPKNNLGESNALSLEHRLTVLRDHGEITVDESGGERAESKTKPVLTSFLERMPTLFDHELGIKLVFADLDIDSEKCHVYPIEKNENGSMTAILPFYYRENDKPSGVIVFEGDLGCRGSELQNFPKAYWSASLGTEAAAQIAYQLVHRFDTVTKLTKVADFSIEFTAAIKELVTEKAENVWLLLIDIDDFKTVNDRFGYKTGDAVLGAVANTLVESVRSEDGIKTVARWGGEEFTVIVRGVTSQEQVTKIAERIRRNVSELMIPLHNSDGMTAVHVTCSIGATDVRSILTGSGMRVVLGNQEDAIQELFAKTFDMANNMLREAKRTGKNRFVFSQTEMPTA